MTARGLSISARLHLHVERITESGCWIWMGAIGGLGYGCMGIGKGFTKRAHRISYIEFVGPIPDGMCVCHRCDVRLCINPSHLFLGTYKDNHADMRKKSRANTARGIRKVNSKLTEEQIRMIRNDPRSQKAISLSYNVSDSRISLIKSRKVWKHII